MKDVQIMRVGDAGSSLKKRGFQIYEHSQWQFPGPVAKHWDALANSWNNLAVDPYMTDGGTYRERRYGSFTYNTLEGSLSPFDRPFFYQSKTINSFAGGIERRFAPLELETCKNRLLHYLIEAGVEHFARTFNVAETLWDIGVQQFRIIARDDDFGLPTPEGIHSDGHDFLSIHLINRDNVEGGMSTVYTNDGVEVASVTLSHPLDSMFVQDTAVQHGVTPIAQADSSRDGIRDMLVIDYNIIRA